MRIRICSPLVLVILVSTGHSRRPAVQGTTRAGWIVRHLPLPPDWRALQAARAVCTTARQRVVIGLATEEPMASLRTAMLTARSARRLIDWSTAMTSVPVWQMLLIGLMTAGSAFLLGRLIGM